MDVSSLLLWIGFLTVFHDSEGGKPCRFNRVYKMLGADCSELNLVQIPAVSRPVEVLDASGNRIRILKNESFVSYDSLRYLYLFDNSIVIIEPGAFDPLVNLEVLDLHLNSIRELPPLLPFTLRKLNLADNDVKTNLPLDHAQSLTFLSLAGNRLSAIPIMGILPQLVDLNMTDNPLEVLNINQLSAFCQLENLRLPTSLMATSYTATCDCVRVNTWILKHSIYVDPQFNCTVIDESECLSNGSSEAQSAYTACKAAHQAFKWTSNSLWTLGIGGAGILLFVTILLLYLWRRKYSKPRSPPCQPSAEEVNATRITKYPNSQFY